MFSDSIILYGIGKLILKIKNDYKKSNLCSVADNFIDRFMNLLNKSLIIQFLTSQIRPEDSAINSGLLTGLQGLKVIYRFLKKIAGFIINNSLIISLMIYKDINFVLFAILLIILPLVPTSLGLIISAGIIGLTVYHFCIRAVHSNTRNCIYFFC